MTANHQTRQYLRLDLDALAFGVMLGPDSMRILKNLHSADDISLRFYPKNRWLNIFFSYGLEKTKGPETPREYKIQIGMAMIRQALEVETCGSSQHLVLPLPFPPRYYRKIKTGHRSSSKTAFPEPQWNRATDIVRGDAGIAGIRGRPVALHQELDNDEHIDIGRWTTLRLTFRNDMETRQFYSHLRSVMAEINIDLQSGCTFDLNITAPTVWSHVDHPLAARAGQPSALLGLPSVIHLDPAVRYQLEVCISQGILSEYTICLDFLQRLAKLAPQDAARRLEYLSDQGQVLYTPLHLFEMEDAERYQPKLLIPYYCTLVRRASITPTTVLFSSPLAETSNRVTRRYRQLQDRFLRIQFIEEAESERITRFKEQGQDICRRLGRTLRHGIRIGDRVYEFLAFGSSQLRQASAYFFCPTDHVSCDDIRSWMGDFRHIKIVAKYAARLGQCFSTTREIRGIPVPQVKYIKDIEHDGHCFSDGVGLISDFLAQAIIQDMTLDVFADPTAFQFRMGGSKGVLVVWPDLKGIQVQIRDSQEKFKSESQNLEVVRCATNSTATLNRQTITLLEFLGIKKKKFLALLKDQIDSYQQAVDDNSVAIELLTKFVDQQQSSLVLAELLKAGFRSAELREPFTTNLVNLWISWSFRLLKDKARILIPKSAFVLGAVDETGTLRGHSSATEGSKENDINKLPQIFLQLTDHKHRHKTVVRGVCLVGRNPSLHPGDIRVVQAVDNPRLRHLTNVVIFPSNGDCPVPSMLSGGDLDGDDYFVTWDPDMVPTHWNYPPMNYEGARPQELNRDVNVDDLREFFVNYLNNDSLGLIATAHLAQADKLGPDSEICLRLAELHSKAVDYPKTGEPALMSARLQPKKWPHFMEKKCSYQSNKALGAVYDEVVKHSTDFRPDWRLSFDSRILDKFNNDKKTLDQARDIKKQYDVAVRRVLAQRNLKTEFELYTGWAMSRPRVGSDYKLQEDLSMEYDALKQNFRDQCYAAVGDDDPDALDNFVAAMYKVTEEDVKAAQDGNQLLNDGGGGDQGAAASSMPLISFPWIFHWVMISLAMGKRYKPGKSVLGAARRMPAASQRKQYLSADGQPRSAQTEAVSEPAVEVQAGSDEAEASDGASFEDGLGTESAPFKPPMEALLACLDR